MDWCRIPDVGNVLIIVDATSGWIECSLPQHRTTENVIETLSSVFCRFGVPRVLVTDNAPEFTSRELNEFCRINGIAKKESPPYHPQSNGVAERGVQTVKNGLRAWRLNTSHISFKEFIKRLLLHHRACFQRQDGRTPAEIVYGRKIRVPLSRNFLFSQPVAYRSRDGALRDATYLLDRGSNTSWIIDAENGKLRLAHQDQLSNRPTSTPEKTFQPLPPASASPIPGISTTPDPEETLPMTEDSPPEIRTRQESRPQLEIRTRQESRPQPDIRVRQENQTRPVNRSPRPRRTRKAKVISDYNDL